MKQQHIHTLCIRCFLLVFSLFSLTTFFSMKGKVASAESPALVRIIHASPVAIKLDANMVASIFALGMLNGNPNIQFIATQVAGIPNLPQTGSDPNPISVSSNSQQLSPWLSLELALILYCTGTALGWFTICYLVVKRPQ